MPHDQEIMHHHGALGQFPEKASDDARASQLADALGASRELSNTGAKPP